MMLPDVDGIELVRKFKLHDPAVEGSKQKSNEVRQAVQGAPFVLLHGDTSVFGAPRRVTRGSPDGSEKRRIPGDSSSRRTGRLSP